MTTRKMEGRFGDNRLDNDAQGVLGRPIDRVDGVRKVTGAADYTADWHGAGLVHGVLVCATVGTGSVAAIDVAAARRAPGVIAIFPRFKGLADAPPPSDDLLHPVPSEVRHVGAPLALVVADTFERARAAAMLVSVQYEGAVPGRFALAPLENAAVTPGPFLFAPDHARGDLAAAQARTTTRIDYRYTTPSHSHAAMEPHVTIASWEGDRLTLRASYQMLKRGRDLLVRLLGIPESRIRIISHFVGGGFGGKTGMSVESIFAAQAALWLKRPVKVVMSRRQVFGATSRRSESIQHIALGADNAGKLTEIQHHTVATNLPGEIFWEPAGAPTFHLYASDTLKVTHKLATMDLVRSGMMRAPGEATGLLAMEVAIDEMAEKLGRDPVAFRIACEPDHEHDPLDGKPFSDRNLTRCLSEGARRFGWDARATKPGRHIKGEWMIGMGVGAAIRTNIFDNSEARVRLAHDGRVIVETDLTDIGTGSYTVMGQIAAEMLGVPMTWVSVSLGDTDLPLSAGSGGSWGAGTTGTAVYIACEDIVAKLAAAMSVAPDDMTLKDGRAIAGNRSVPLRDLVPPEGFEALGRAEPGANYSSHVQATFGAHFVEVAVSRLTGEIRLRRMLGVFDVGRILNEKMARSQLIGGMIFGIGSALSEELVVDSRWGNFVNGDLGEYLVPVNADVPAIDVAFLPTRDAWANPLKAKGIGELGICGAGAAIANAVYNACGVRVRDFPITLDKILAGLPDMTA